MPIGHILNNIWALEIPSRMVIYLPVDGEKMSTLEGGNLTDGLDQHDPSVCVMDYEGSSTWTWPGQEKALLGGTDFMLELLPNLPRFYLKTTNGFAVEVEFLDTVYYVHRMRLTSKVRDAHSEALQIAPARYPLTRCEVYHTTIGMNKFDEICDNVVIGTLPRRIIVGLISVEAFNGFEHGSL